MIIEEKLRALTQCERFSWMKMSKILNLEGPSIRSAGAWRLVS